MKKLFEAAVRYHPSIERVIKGTNFVSCKDWYGKVSRELGVQASYASQMERDGMREAGRGRGQSPGSPATTGTRDGRPNQSKFGKFHQRQGQDAQHHQGKQHFSATGNKHSGSAQMNTMMAWNGSTWSEQAVANAMEPMTAGRGGGRGDRGGRGGGRGRARSEPPYGQRTASPQGRGDRYGSAQGERFGTRAPINDPRRESAEALPKGPYWHQTGDLLKCQSATCGQPFDSTIFCQGCAWKGHSRPWCYKSNEPGFNPTGYWSTNRPGQGPLPGKKGEFRGPKAQFNLMDSRTETQQQGGAKSETA